MKSIAKTIGVGFRGSLVILISSLVFFFLNVILIAQAILTPNLRVILFIFSLLLMWYIHGRFLIKSKRFIFGGNNGN